MTNRRTKVLFPVFNGYEVRVICACDVAATGRRLKGDLADSEAGFITQEDAPGIGWLILGTKPTPGHIAHEATHAVKALFAFAGVGEDEETFAYHLDFLVGRIHKFVQRVK